MWSFFLNIEFPKPLEFNNNKYFNFKKADYETINQAILSIDWYQLFGDRSLTLCLDIFYKKIEIIIVKQNVPSYTKNKHFPTFYSQATIKAIKEKNKTHKKWCKFKCTNDYNLFKNLRARSKSLIKTDFVRYLCAIEDDLVTNPRRFWNYASIKKQSVSNFPSEMHWGNKVVSSGSGISNLFGSYFESVFVPENHQYRPGCQSSSQNRRVVFDNE